MKIGANWSGARLLFYCSKWYNACILKTKSSQIKVSQRKLANSARQRPKCVSGGRSEVCPQYINPRTTHPTNLLIATHLIHNLYHSRYYQSAYHPICKLRRALWYHLPMSLLAFAAPTTSPPFPSPRSTSPTQQACKNAL